MISLRHKEKFRRALYCLAVGEEDVRDRLRHAYAQIKSLREDEIPSGIRQEWRGILKDLTKRGPLIQSGSVLKNDLDHTLDKMRKKTAREIAERLYRITIDIK